MKVIIKCGSCGREIEKSEGSRKAYCCYECQKEAAKRRARERAKEKTTKTNNTLTEIALLAQQSGMSYGKYVAQFYSTGGKRK